MYYQAAAYTTYGTAGYGSPELPPSSIPFSTLDRSFARPDPAVGCCVGAPPATRFTLVRPFWLSIRPRFGNGFLSFVRAGMVGMTLDSEFQLLIVNEDGQPVTSAGSLTVTALGLTWGTTAAEAQFVTAGRLSLRSLMSVLGQSDPTLGSARLWLTIDGYDGSAASIQWSAS